METVTDFIFLGSKITMDSDCSHEIKRYLLLGRKNLTNVDSILKSKDITLKPGMAHGGLQPSAGGGCQNIWKVTTSRFSERAYLKGLR